MTLGKKIVTSKIALVLVPAAVITGIAVWQTRDGFARALEQTRTAFDGSTQASREEVLSAHLFESIADVQEITDDWLRRYNEIRPHDALGSLPPARYREKLLAE